MIDRKRRVAVTGIGVISPLGLTASDFWTNLVADRSGVSSITLFDAAALPTRIAAEVRGFDPSRYVARRKSLKVMMRDMQFAVAAAKEAVADARLEGAGIDPQRIGVVFGAGMISTDIEEIAPAIRHSRGPDGRFDLVRFGKAGIRHLFPLWLLKQLPNMLASHVAIIYDAQGPSNTITTGCSSSAHAIGEAYRIISRGGADLIITGGASSSITPLKLIRYDRLGVLSRRNDEPERASRPFDAARDGFVIGEGAGVVVLEEWEGARARGAAVHAEVVGYGNSVDIRCGEERRVEPSSKARAMRAALADGGLDPGGIGYISAHGNSIPFTDRLETSAVKEVFGDRAAGIPVSSIKGNIGDLGPAAGALGLISTVLAMRHRLIPCTRNYETPDPACDLDYVPAPRRADVSCALCNSFDFMGQNVSIVLRRPGAPS
ncbi:MAG: beta-ketoacyl-ACP synthase II [bacterium]|nr:beta-ketoacyl-ACP synthase II [bacterium]